MGMGGKGANQAVGSRLLGADVTMVGRVGDDLFGQRMLDTLKSYVSYASTSFRFEEH
jgi:ribokinase